MIQKHGYQAMMPTITACLLLKKVPVIDRVFCDGLESSQTMSVVRKNFGGDTAIGM
jgi:hypothetical protein